MTDEELMWLARKAGWSGCDPLMRDKLLAFGKLIVKHKNRLKHKPAKPKEKK